MIAAVAEKAVVSPVGGGSAYRDHRDVVNEEHDEREYGKTQPAVSNDLVDLIALCELVFPLLLIAGPCDFGDIDVALVGDYRFRVVVELLFRRLDILFDMLKGGRGDLHLLKHLFIAFEYLYSVPALLLLGHIVNDSLLDVSERVLDRAGEGVLRNGFAVMSRLYRGLGGFLDARFTKRGDLNYLAAYLAGKLCNIDLVAFLFDDVHHIDGDDYRYAELRELGREVEVPFEVGAVNDIEDRIGALLDEVIPGNDLLQSVGGERVDAGKVGDGNFVVLFELAFLLFDSNARPVSNELV